MNNETIWSGRYGKTVEADFKPGDFLGIENDKQLNERIFLIDESLQESLPLRGEIGGFVGGAISDIFGRVTGRKANLSGGVELGISKNGNRSEAGKLQAGFGIDAGFNLGELNWDLPVYTDAIYTKVNNGLLFDLSYQKDNDVFTSVEPSFKFDVFGFIESDAEIYAQGDIFGEFKFKQSFQLPNIKHSFIDIDSSDDEKEKIDLGFYKNEFQLGNADDSSDSINLGDFALDFDFPDFESIGFLPQSSKDNLLFSNLLDFEFEDSYVYSMEKTFTPVDFEFDLDGALSRIFPGFIPTFKDKRNFNILGQDVGYDIDIALLDINPNLAVEVDFQVDFGFTNFLPTVNIEGISGTFEAEEAEEQLSFLGSNSVGGQLDAQTIVNQLYDRDSDNDGNLDITLTIDPEIFVSAKASATPKVGVKGGIGAGKIDITGVNGLDEALYSFDESIPVADSWTIFEEHNSDPVSQIDFLDNLSNSYQLEIPIAEIAAALGVDVWVGTNGPDYFAGGETGRKDELGKDLILLKGGPDVARLMPGVYTVNGGSESLSTVEFSYYDPFGNGVTRSEYRAGDIFVLDSDINAGEFGGELIVERYEKNGNESFTLYHDVYDQAVNLIDVEGIVLSDELQASTQGLYLDFSALGGYGKRKILLGGRRPNEYAVNLPQGQLLGTAGDDYLVVPEGYDLGFYALGDGDDTFELVSSEPFDDQYPKLDGNFTLSNGLSWKNPYAEESDQEIYGKSDESIYQDLIDLGDGNNTVLLGIDNPDYGDIFISSVNPGKNNDIFGSLRQDSIRAINLGGSSRIDLSIEEAVDISQIYGIFSGGNNEITLRGEDKKRSKQDLTFLVDSQSFESKVNYDGESPVIVSLEENSIIYASVGFDDLELVDTLDPDVPIQNLTLASADIIDESARKELGGEERYALESPGQQLYTVFESVAEQVTIRGRSDVQKNDYRGIWLADNEVGQIKLGPDLYDEVITDPSALDDLSLGDETKIGSLLIADWSQIADAVRDGKNPSRDFIKDDLEIRTASLPTTYLEIEYLHTGNVTVSTPPGNNGSVFEEESINNLLTVFGESASPNSLNSFKDSIYASHLPLHTHHFKEGDDKIYGHYLDYEHFYPGGGNNVILNLILEGYTGKINTAEPVTLDSKLIDHTYSEGDTTKTFGDVVIYTEGSILDYTISRSSQYEQAVEVKKKDGTVDLLFGISLIKFETEDVEYINYPGDSSQTEAEYDLSDNIFGQSDRQKLFYSQTTDGRTLQLESDWAIDRVDLAGDIIYQPGVAPLSWTQDIPTILNEFSLTKELLVSQFQDNDITEKELYSLEDLEIANLTVSQEDNIVPVELQDGQWQVKPENGVDFELGSFEVSYTIVEPEGYSHLVSLTLNPTEIVELEVLQNQFNIDRNQEIIGDEESNFIIGTQLEDRIQGGDGNDVINGEDGNDVLSGDLGQDIITGDLGDDTLSGGLDDDLLAGEAGNDYLDGGDGANILQGGEGDDTYIINLATSAGSEIEDLEGNDILAIDNAQISLATPAKDSIGLAKNNTALIVDLNRDGSINFEEDLRIVNYFDESGTGAGTGYIESVANLNGEDILNLLALGNDFEPPGSTVDRFFNPSVGVHFYTADQNESDYVLENLDNYQYEGESYVTVDPASGNNPEEVYRFFNSTTGVHLYTTDEGERDYIIDNLSNFAYEDVKFHAYETEVAESIPVHRFYEPTIGVHFYTPNEGEKIYVEENLSNYSYEGIAYYAFPVDDM